MICKNFIAFFKEKVKGFVKFHQCYPGKMCKVIFNLYGMKPNSTFAIHIHEFGDLTDGCKSLGGHLNLKNVDHGSIFIDIQKSHTGDLINNIFTDQNGEFKYEYYDTRLNLFENIDQNIVGCSVVIHYGVDDYGLENNEESKKTGNAGGRMDCAIIGKMKNI
jgi:Cu-Zn family superoxide dismutase